MNIYVGNLKFETTDDGLQKAFEAYGTVETASVIMDRDSGRSRGFGFVEMPNDSEAQAAIDGLNGTDLDGRQIKVNKARPRAPRRPRNNYGGNRDYGSSRDYGGGGGNRGSYDDRDNRGPRW